jgi:transposase-like protein
VPTEVTTDRAAAYPRVLEELVPGACHVTERYANNAIEADHGRLKSRLRPMRGLKQLRCATVRIDRPSLGWRRSQSKTRGLTAAARRSLADILRGGICAKASNRSGVTNARPAARHAS